MLHTCLNKFVDLYSKTIRSVRAHKFNKPDLNENNNISCFSVFTHLLTKHFFIKTINYLN